MLYEVITFFQNLTSFMVGYLCVGGQPDLGGQGRIDWDWLSAQTAEETFTYTRHIRLGKPLIVNMNNRERRGIILKPEV